MRNRLLLVTVLILVAIMVFAGCEKPSIAGYTIPMLDLDEGVIKTGEVNDSNKGSGEIIYKFSDEIRFGTKEKPTPYKNFFGNKVVVADKDDFGKDYMAHPDSILLKRKAAGADAKYEFGEEILTVFPLAHGKGEIKGKVSFDGGLTYPKENTLQNTPGSWKRSQETPVLYRLTFSDDNKPDDNDLIILTAGNPRWPGDSSFKANGFNVSISAPSKAADGGMEECRVWSEFETWYGHGGDANIPGAIIRKPQGYMKAADPIVAMSSLTRLKDAKTKQWTDRWMGLFHDHSFNCYKTILEFKTRDEILAEKDNKETREELEKYPTYTVPGAVAGETVQKLMTWTAPVKYFDEYRKIERKSNMCEVECVRSEGGQGDELMLLTRSNSKIMNSLVSYSSDEGETWSAPRELPFALSGERHKAEWFEMNGEQKLFITFRSIERSTSKAAAYPQPPHKWTSEGYVAWVGTWDDIKAGREGEFRVKIGHTYLNGQTGPQRNANADTGYCGNAVYYKTAEDGHLVPYIATCSYGIFSPYGNKAREGQTYIAGRVLNMEQLFELMAMKDAAPETQA